jgi:hypothetical protein
MRIFLQDQINLHKNWLDRLTCYLVSQLL